MKGCVSEVQKQVLFDEIIPLQTNTTNEIETEKNPNIFQEIWRCRKKEAIFVKCFYYNQNAKIK